MKKLRSWIMAVGPKTFRSRLLEAMGFACATKGAHDIYAPAGWIVAAASFIVMGVGVSR